MRKLIAMDIRLIDDRRVTDDAAVDADAADDKNVGREGNERANSGGGLRRANLRLSAAPCDGAISELKHVVP